MNKESISMNLKQFWANRCGESLGGIDYFKEVYTVIKEELIERKNGKGTRSADSQSVPVDGIVLHNSNK